MKITPDVWISEQLGRPTFRVEVDETFDELALQAHQQGHVFMYTKVPVSRLDAVSRFEDNGFRVVDMNITFEKPTQPVVDLSGPGEVCFARPEHAAGVVAVASRNFVYSRFHLDPQIPRRIADRLKARWVENFFRGQRGSAMVVALLDGVVAGFNLLVFDGQRNALTIDLIATDATHRRKGLARKMIGFAEAHCPGFERVRVGTQIANLPSIQLYESIGFRVASAEYVLHYHG